MFLKLSNNCPNILFTPVINRTTQLVKSVKKNIATWIMKLLTTAAIYSFRPIFRVTRMLFILPDLEYVFVCKIFISLLLFFIISLINNFSADSEKEEDMVDWLREVGMPADYVNKLARMFQDIKVSEDLNGQFRASTARHDAINIKILNAGAWARGSERVTVSLPVELEDYIPEIEEFYKKKHSGRKLQW